MRIKDGVMLDFKDVLILPKRSTLDSRSQVSLERNYHFRNSNRNWTGIPIMVANMDTTGTFSMAQVMSKLKILTCIHKFYSIQEWTEFINNLHADQFNHIVVSSGIADGDFEKLDEILSLDNRLHWICLDVANGYTEKFVSQVKKLRFKYPNHIIIAGNVVTGDMTEELILSGADVIKGGIGGGCFIKDTRVLMADGTYQNINEIKKGDYVINKDGKPVKVINVMNQGIKNVLKINTNNWHNETYVTPDHRYWIGDLSTSSYECIQSSGIVKLLDKKAKTVPKTSKYKWKEIDNIDKESMMTLMPRYIEWKLQDDFKIDLADYTARSEITEDSIITQPGNIKINRFINSSYDLGYILGTYVGDGNAKLSLYQNSERGSCHWSFGINEKDIADKLQKAIFNLLNYECKISIKDNKVLSVNCYNKTFTRLLMECNKKTEKHLPSKYYCKNKEYIQGLFDGLIDSDGSVEIGRSKLCNYSFTNTSTKLLELYYWCCINLGYSFCGMKRKKSIGNLKGTSIENLQQGYAAKTHTTNRYTKDYVYGRLLSKEPHKEEETWDIEVDCPTHSFIANNSIVHNSVCTTRIKTGVGCPQLSAVIECSDAAHGLKGHLISDGGCINSGDISKAFAGGADFVMLGGMMAGHDESGGNVIEKDGKTFVEFYGMSSTTAMEKHYGEKAHYRAAEGKKVLIPYRGPVIDTINDILGGIRSTCTYVGAPSLKELSKRTTFIRVSLQSNEVYGKN